MTRPGAKSLRTTPLTINQKGFRKLKLQSNRATGACLLAPRPPPPRANDEEATPEGADAAFYSKLSCDQNAMHGRLPRGWAGARRRVPVTRLEESPSRHLPLQLNLQRAGHPAASANRSHLAASARSPCKRFWIEAVKEVSLKSVFSKLSFVPHLLQRHPRQHDPTREILGQIR